MALPVPTTGLPPGGGEFIVQPQYTFNALTNSSAKSYISRFDNALRSSRENAWRMRLDPMIDSCLEVRCTPTALLPVSVKPQDEADPQEIAAAKRQEGLLRRIPRITELRRWLLKEGAFVGRAGAQITWTWTKDKQTGRMMTYPDGYRLLNGDKLQFAWDGTPGIAVNSGSGLLSHPNCVMLDGFPVYFPTAEERPGLIIHRSFSEDADFYRPWFAGSIHGTGLRGKLYWVWALKSQLWQMGIDFLRWFSKGFTVYYYEYGNQKHLDAIQTAIQQQDGNTAIAYPVFGELADPKSGKPYFQKPFEHINVSTASPQFLQELITQYFDDLVRFAILHQSLTTTTAATGLGSGVANAHQSTFDNVVKLDATLLDDTFTEEVLAVMYATNEPGVPCGRVMSQVDSPNVAQMMEAAQGIVEMGGSVAAQPIMDAAGIPEAKAGETLLGNVPAGNPTAVDAVPNDVPVQSAADDSNTTPV